MVPSETVQIRRAVSAVSLHPHSRARWRLLLRETVEALLAEAEAETTSDEDRKLLQRPSRLASNNSAARALSRGTTRGGDRRRRAAILCRMGEKQLLRSVLEEVNAALAEGL